MTATPTPLRELIAKWRAESARHSAEAVDRNWSDWVREKHRGQAWSLHDCANELEAALSARDEAGAVDGFRVSVAELRASNGTTYHVCIDRPGRPLDAKPWDEGRMEVRDYENREHAEAEAEEWRAFFATREAGAVGWVDPQSLVNLASGKSSKEWMWAKPEAGNVPVFATPPASGEAGACNCPANGKTNAILHAPNCPYRVGVVRAFQEEAATPPAASGDESIDATDNADYIEHCVDRLARCGFPITGRTLGVIAAEYRRLAAVAPAGMAVTAEMVREAFAHVPFDTKGYARWEWFANFINQALARPDDPCQCCGVTPSGQITGAT